MQNGWTLFTSREYANCKMHLYKNLRFGENINLGNILKNGNMLIIIKYRKYIVHCHT